MKWLSYGPSNGYLLVFDATTEQLVWRGYPEGRPVKKVSQLTNLTGCIVLVEWEGVSKHDQNLWRYSHDEGVIWRAELPQSGPDSYMDFELERGELYAGSWSCFKVKIDLESGRIIGSTFVK